MPKKLLTLCMIIKDNRILLGMKKRGFGAGRWNGFGGKVEQGETIEQAAKREILEEAGLTPVKMKQCGVIDFSFEDDPKVLEVHIFRIDSFTGEPVETEEMKPQWFDVDAIPYEQMWSDDKYWLPLLIQDRPFKGKFRFDQPSTADYDAKILSQELIEA